MGFSNKLPDGADVAARETIHREPLSEVFRRDPTQRKSRTPGHPPTATQFKFKYAGTETRT